jgi:cytochrome c553
MPALPVHERGDPDVAEAMSARLCCAGAILLVAAAGPAAATDRVEDGRRKAVQCVACHGLEGVAPNPTFPHLGGQNAAYLAIQLERFRTGERYDPLMTPVAEALSDQDIEDLATYYSELRPSAEARSEP